MAVIYDRSSNTFSHIGVPFNYTRGNPLPIDNSSVWPSLSAAEEYAKTSPVAYVGQIVTVVDQATGTVDVYKINTDSTLSLVAPAIKIDVDDLPLSAGNGIEITETGYINAKVSGAISTDNDENIILNVGDGLKIENNAVQINVLNLFGGTATEVSTEIYNNEANA